MWKIQLSKFTVQFLGHLISFVSRLFGRSKEPSINFLPMKDNPSLPFGTTFVPADSFKSARIITPLSGISELFRPSGLPEISTSIVKRFLVLMISFFIFRTSKNQSVHTNSFAGISGPSRIKTFGSSAPICIPIPSGQPAKIFGIYDGNLFSCQWDKAVRCIKRLNNLVSFHAVFHWPSFKGLVRFSRYFTTLLLFGLFATFSYGQIKQITGGGYQYPNGTTCSGCVLTLQLTADAVVSGTGQIAPKIQNYTLDASGNVPASSTLWGNDQLQPNGTTYKAFLNAAGGGQIWGPEYFSVTGASPINLAQLIPVANPAVYFSNPAVTNLANTFTQLQTFNAGLTSTTGTFTGTVTAKNVNFFRYVDALNLSNWAGANVTAWTQSAINDCGSTPCVVIVNPNAGLTPANIVSLTLPDNVGLQYYVQGRLQIRSNPTTAPIGASCGISLIVGSPSFSDNNPAVNNCMPFYGAIQTSAAQNTAWGANTFTGAGPGVSGGNLWGYEVDVAPNSGTSGAFGFDAVSAGSNGPATFPAFRALTATNTVAVGQWDNALLVQGGVRGTAIVFASPDTGLQITQAITVPGAQTVTTNATGGCSTPPFPQLYVGRFLSVDSGGQQEDVSITNTTCANGVWSITCTFTKTHAINTVFTEYLAQRLWDASSGASKSPPYIWGSIQNYNISNTPQPLGFYVYDSAGILRLINFFTSTNQHIFRDVGGGFVWQSLSGGTNLSLSSAGDLQLPTPGTASSSVATLGATQTLTNKTISTASGNIITGTGASSSTFLRGDGAWTTPAGLFTSVNVTPVTVNANVATDQNGMAITLTTGALNFVSRTLLIQLAGVYSTPAASTTTLTHKLKLCTVSGCGSGTVITLASWITSALGGVQATNNPYNCILNSSTQTAGASSAFEAHGNLTIDLAALSSAAESVFADNNTATIGTIDSTAQLFLQHTIAFGTASASNSATDRQMIADTVD